MSLILDGSAGVTFPSGSGTQAAQSKVLQVVNATYSTAVTTTGTTLIDSGLTATITPLFSTSKILVITYEPMTGRNTGSSGNPSIQLSLQRNGTQIAYVGRFVLTDTASPSAFQTQAFNVLDNPATTSALTYKVQFSMSASGTGATAFHNVDGNLATITLMEIAG